MTVLRNIKQDVVADTNNSFDEPLDSGNSYTFTGAATSTLGVAGIQVSLKTDKNCTVQVQQAPDLLGNWDIIDEYTYYYSKGGQSWTTQAVNSYVRVIITVANPAEQTTSYFRLQTALCPIVEALPRALDDEGYLKTCANLHSEHFDKEVIVTPMNALKVANSVRLSGTTFVGTTVDPNFWVSALGVGGSAAQAAGEMTLGTGTTANNQTSITSSRIARYMGSAPNTYRSVIRIPAWTTGSAGHTCTAQWGAFDDLDGFYFEAVQTNPAVTPTLQLRSRKTVGGNTVDAAAITVFNGDLGASYILDNNVHTYEIFWTNSSVWYFIDGMLLHKTNSAIATLTATLSLKVSSLVKNGGGNTFNNTLVIRVSTISRLGALQTSTQYFHGTTAATNRLKYGPGILHKIIVGNSAGTLITVVDNFTGSTPVISVINSPQSDAPFILDFDLAFNTGLSIISTGTWDYTVVYE
jgi:hypothetical protein